MKLSYLYIIFLLAFLASCTERIDIELDDTYTRLVVEGNLTNETKSHRITLSKTTSYFANQPAPKVSGAIVNITDGTHTYPLTETSPGIYETASDVQGIAGNIYMLNISNVDIDNDGNEETYSASSLLRPVALLDSIRVEFLANWKYWTVKVYALDPPTTDYYMFRAYNNGVLITDTLDEVVVVDDLLFNGNYTNGIVSQFFEEAEADIGDTITFEMAGITKEYTEFIIEVQTETGYSNPLFSGPPANIKGNISNGALGFFAAYSVVKADYVIDKK